MARYKKFCASPICEKCHRLGRRELAVVRNGRPVDVMIVCDHCGAHYPAFHHSMGDMPARLMALGLIYDPPAPKVKWNEFVVSTGKFGTHYYDPHKKRKSKLRLRFDPDLYPNTATYTPVRQDALPDPGEIPGHKSDPASPQVQLQLDGGTMSIVGCGHWNTGEKD